MTQTALLNSPFVMSQPPSCFQFCIWPYIHANTFPVVVLSNVSDVFGFGQSNHILLNLSGQPVPVTLTKECSEQGVTKDDVQSYSNDKQISQVCAKVKLKQRSDYSMIGRNHWSHLVVLKHSLVCSHPCGHSALYPSSQPWLSAHTVKTPEYRDRIASPIL